MRSPDRPGIGSTGYLDDRPGHSCRTVCCCLLSGSGAGGGVRLFLPPPEAASPSGGRLVFACPVSGVDLSELWDLPGGFASGLCPGPFPGNRDGCSHLRAFFAAGLSTVLADSRFPLAALEKIFQKNKKICKKTIGIRKKMVYNKKEYGQVSDITHRRNRT